MTSQDLGYKPSAVEKAKFEYSPLGKVFNKGLRKKDRKKDFHKDFQNVKVKNKEQLKEIKYQGERQLDIVDKQGKNH